MQREKHRFNWIIVAFSDPIKPTCKAGFIGMGNTLAPWFKRILVHQRPFKAVFFSPVGGGLFEPNLENEGSISGSDSAFYRQLEGTVA